MSTVSRGATVDIATLKTSPAIALEQSIEVNWDTVEDVAAMIALLGKIENQGMSRSIMAKKISWASDEYTQNTDTLAATVGFSAGANAIASAAAVVGTAAGVIALTSHKYYSGDVIYIANATDWLQVRLGTYTGAGTAGYLYNVAEVMGHTRLTAAGSAQFSAGASVTVCAPAINYDGEARDYLNIRPTIMTNVMQRIRDTIGRGKLERSEKFLVNYSIEYLAKLGFKRFMQKINKSLYTNFRSFQASAGATDYGHMGGFPHFLNPGDWTTGMASSTYQGVNRVDTGTTVDYGNFAIDYSQALFEKGSKNRVVNCPPVMASKILNGVRNEVSVDRNEYLFLPSMERAIGQMPSFETGFGRVWLNVDRGAAGIRTQVFDDTTTTRSNDYLYWALCIDPENVGVSWMEVDGMGVMSPRISNVFKQRNNTIEEIEFDAVMSLLVKRPDTCGYYGIDNS